MPTLRSFATTGIVVLLLSVGLFAAQPSLATGGGDAGSGADAGGSTALATRVEPRGYYFGNLTSGDEDVYAFFVPAGRSINIGIDAGIATGTLVAPDNGRRPAFQLLGPGGVLLDTPNSNQGDARVTLAAAPLAGDHYLRVTSGFGFSGSYRFCFVEFATPCPTEVVGVRSIDLSSGLPVKVVEVLLVPPANGDLGDAVTGPTALDYLEATLRGIHRWEPAIDAFTARHPEFAYLQELVVHVEVFDGVQPARLGYDVIIVWDPYSGPMFRGFAGSMSGGCCLAESLVHASGRYIVLSLFANSPRAGQLLPDWPEKNDVENVAMHEFAHTWGLGHSTTWTAQTGPDLMVSPAPFVFGNGATAGDGGERTPLECISSLDLYGLAKLYAWIPRGNPNFPPYPGNSATLPASIPYELYC